MSTILSDIRVAVKAALDGLVSGGYTLDAANVRLGYHARVAGTISQYTEVLAAPTKPIVVIGPVTAGGIATRQLKYGLFSFPMECYLFKTKSVDRDMKDIDDLVFDIINALTSDENFTTVPMPAQVDLTGWTWETASCDGLLALSFVIQCHDP